jgi:hypothetical protein
MVRSLTTDFVTYPAKEIAEPQKLQGRVSSGLKRNMLLQESYSGKSIAEDSE